MLPTDDELIAFLCARPSQRLRDICDHFDVPYVYTAASHAPAGTDYGYTPETRRVAVQLQRLRRAGRIKAIDGQRWGVVKDYASCTSREES